MTYEVVCPKGHKLAVDESSAGGRIVCPVCSEPFTVSRPANTGAPLPPVQPANQVICNAPASGCPCVEVSKVAGRPALALGLVLVLLARGCDMIEKRGIERAAAKAQVVEAQFEDPWNKQRSDLERKIATLQEKENPAPEDTKELQDDRNSLRDLDKSRQKALRTFEATTLQDVKIASRDAAANYHMGAYWWQMLFVLGAVILAVGLLMVSSIAQGAERWVALSMIVIITFSLFIIGFAWMPLGP